ncbi:MAG: hypothetical protein PHS53_00180 [Candidatus Pacebacteria bacterium]|nr:hypothetical protein [Candidatus Paceibacterota bacterium]
MEPNQTQSTQGPDQDKTMAIIAYIIFFVPLLMGNRSQFVNYHTNQGTVLFIFMIILQVVLSFLVFIPLIGLLLQIARLLPFVLMVIGIMNAAKGAMNPLPIIGGFTIIK